MKRFETAIDIAAPAERVWEIMQEVERWREWTPSIAGIKRLDRGPFGVGSRALVRQPRLPPALWKVTVLEPGRGFNWVSTAPGVRVTGKHWVEPITGGSRATLSLEMEGVFSGLLARLTGAITEQYIRLEAKGLKARSEDSSFRHGVAGG